MNKVRVVNSYLSEEVVEYGGTALSHISSARKLFAAKLENRAQEVFAVAYLDSKNKLIGYREITSGTINSSLVHPREVFGPAVSIGAVSIIIGHNHPSGDPLPSNEDNAVTKRLYNAGSILGIPLLDHIIIGNDCYYGYRESGTQFLSLL